MKESRSFVLKNKLGLHARAAALLVTASSQYKSKIFLEKDGVRVNGKSILGILTLACPQGGVITVNTDGVDAREAMDKLAEIIESKFGEP
ncbi:MAG TPA: HPr family phosphocarrier protein [Syntrophales bacterium]|nr:HPr family phosphocarrier protein [Syntrophales bacterium]